MNARRPVEESVPVRVTPSSATPRRGPLLVALLAIVALLAPSAAIAARPAGPVDIQILNVSDWHGQIDPNGSPPAVGGAAYLSTLFKDARQANPNTLTLTAGDSVGATPPLSAYFEDVPAIISERLMGLDADTLGNHNFDSGLGRLQDQIDLAGDVSGAVPGKPFTYLSANLKNVNENVTGVDKMKMFNVGGVKVAVIGITNPEAPELVLPGAFGTIQITDPVAAANRQREVARRAGASVVIALIHAGITGEDPITAAKTGPLVDFANAVTGYDLILGDHTDVQYSGIHNGALVTENRSKGLTYSKVRLTVQNGAVTQKGVDFLTPTIAGVTPDPAVVSMLDPYRLDLAEIFDEKIAVATAFFPRGGNVERSGEVAIGNLVADALGSKYDTQLALYNAGSIRQPLPTSYVPLDTTLNRSTPPYDIVVGDPYGVLPFGNTLVVRDVTGAQLWAAMENGVSRITSSTCLGADGRFPQISGFKFAFDCTAAAGSRILWITLTDGTAIPNSAASTYSLTTSNFVNAGGDGYTMFKDGQGASLEPDADVLRDYLRAVGTITPTIDGRIVKVNAPVTP